MNEHEAFLAAIAAILSCDLSVYGKVEAISAIVKAAGMEVDTHDTDT